MWKRTVVLLVALVIAGCGNDSEESPDDVAVELGCHFREEETDELFVRHLYKCDNTRVYFFNDTKARNDWWTIAREVGGVELRRGDRWIQVKN